MIFTAGEVFSNCSNQFDPYLSQDDCVFSKMYELMDEKIGCTVPFLLNKSKICTGQSNCICITNS